MKKIILGLTAVAGLSFAGCLKQDKSICKYDPCQYKAPATEIAAVEHYLDSVGLTATEHCSGMYYRVLDPGTGASPQDICATVGVRYTGSLADGTVFEEQNQTVNFQLGTIIEGWKKGIPLMKAGGRFQFFIPPALAYGSNAIKDRDGDVIIPANSMLIFDVQLMGVY